MSVTTLVNLSSDKIRQNWDVYQEYINSTPFHDILWDNWCKKFKKDKTSYIVKLLCAFVSGTSFDGIIVSQYVFIELTNESTLMLTGLNSKEREKFHKISTHLGLHHQSKQINGKRTLFIYKPNPWLWEFSQKNPYPNPKEKRKQELEKRKRERLSKIFCDECGVNGNTEDLCVSVYFSGIYCVNCTGIISDGNGGKLDDHKIESLADIQTFN